MEWVMTVNRIETYIPVHILNMHKAMKDNAKLGLAKKGTARQAAPTSMATDSALLWLRSFLFDTKMLDIKAPKTVHPRKVV